MKIMFSVVGAALLAGSIGAWAQGGGGAQPAPMTFFITRVELVR